MSVDWNEQFKIRLSNISNSSMDKHDVVKLLLVRKLCYRYRRNRNMIRVYTEFDLDNGNKCDIYFEDLKNKSVIIYEIQKEISESYIKEKSNQYRDYEVPFFDTVDFMIIPLKDCPEKINEINSWLDKYLI